MPLNLTLPPAAAFNPLTRLQLTLEALTEPELLVLQATASEMLINRHIAETRQATPEHRKAAPASSAGYEGRALVRLRRSLARLRFFSWAQDAPPKGYGPTPGTPPPSAPIPPGFAWIMSSDTAPEPLADG